MGDRSSVPHGRGSNPGCINNGYKFMIQTHRQKRPLATERPLPNQTYFLRAPLGRGEDLEIPEAYRAAKNFRMRSSPRSNSALDVAYETRMWSVVPNPSPGTVATCASRSSLPATSDADFSPPRPRKDEIFG